MMTTTKTLLTVAVAFVAILRQPFPVRGDDSDSPDIETTQFEQVHLCADVLPGSQSGSADSKVMCAARCVNDSTCSAISYLSTTRTCILQSGNLAAHTCLNATTSAQHLKKVQQGLVCLNGAVALNETTCGCKNGYVGDMCERLMADCQDGIQSGLYPDLKGLKAIMPVNASAPINVVCEKSVQHWIFRRWHNNLDFNTTKADYVNGIGSGSEYSDYWVGLENLHILTTRNPYTYNLGVQINNMTLHPFRQIIYQGFKVRSAAEGYSMTFTSFFTSSNAYTIPMGDCFSPLKDIPFSAFDDDNDGNPSRNCAADYGGGWWYNASCSECNVVGPIRRDNLTRIPGAVNELFWLPGIEPQDYSPGSVFMYLFRF